MNLINSHRTTNHALQPPSPCNQTPYHPPSLTHRTLALNPHHPNLITYRHPCLTLDLHSASATRTPTFTFPLEKPPREQPPQGEPIILLNCTNPFSTCLHVKAWLLDQHTDPAYSAPGILRMDYLELEKIDRARQGWVIVAPQVAPLDAGEFKHEAGPAGGQRQHAAAELRVSVLAVLVKGDQRVRWFYSLHPISSLLARLDEHGLVRDPEWLTPTSPVGKERERYGRIFAFVREAFGNAIRVEESADFVGKTVVSLSPSIFSGHGWRSD